MLRGLGAIGGLGILGGAGLTLGTRPALALDSGTVTATDIAVRAGTDGTIDAVRIDPEITLSWRNLAINRDANGNDEGTPATLAFYAGVRNWEYEYAYEPGSPDLVLFGESGSKTRSLEAPLTITDDEPSGSTEVPPITTAHFPAGERTTVEVLVAAWIESRHNDHLNGNLLVEKLVSFDVEVLSNTEMGIEGSINPSGESTG